MQNTKLTYFIKQILTYSLNSGLLVPLFFTSFIINILSISTPIFVILIFGKYLNYGNHNTLILLTAGAVFCIVLELCFRNLRFMYSDKLGMVIFEDIDYLIIHKILCSGDNRIYSLTLGDKERLLRGINDVRYRFSPDNIGHMLDVPFMLFFIWLIFLINENLALLVFSFCISYVILMHISRRKLKSVSEEYSFISDRMVPNIKYFANYTIDARLSCAVEDVCVKYTEENVSWADAQSELAWQKHKARVNTRFATAILTVVTIGAGSYWVVLGSLNIGELIGINILAVRALAPISAISGLYESIMSTAQFFKAFSILNNLQERAESQIIPSQEFTKVSVKNLSFSYFGQSTLLFSPINISLKFGDILIIKGASGSGKSTLLNILYGDLIPLSGDIYVDDIPLQSINTIWWRKQISYRNEGDDLYPGSLRRVFINRLSNVSDKEIIKCLEMVGLNSLLKAVPDILEQPSNSSLIFGNSSVSGLIKLALALITDGKIVILDNPSAALNSTARNVLYKVMNELSQAGKIIVCVTDDAEIIRGGTHFIDLSRYDENHDESTHQVYTRN